MKKVRIVAAKRGTYTSASGIYHVDPDGTERARSRFVPLDVANAMKDRGLVTIKRGTETEDQNEDFLAERSARRVARIADAGIAPILGAGGEGTRDTTNGSFSAFAGGDPLNEDLGTDDDRELPVGGTRPKATKTGVRRGRPPSKAKRDESEAESSADAAPAS